MPEIKVGDLVIRGDNADAPCQQCASLVTRIEGETAWVLYIARRQRKHTAKELRVPNPWPVSELTKVEDFGVEIDGLTLNDAGEWYIPMRQTSESTAKYKDGVPRRWDPGYACVVDETLIGMILRHVGVVPVQEGACNA